MAFGLVSVPVRLYGARKSHDVELHQVHDEDGGRIRYERRCEICGKKVAYEDIDRAYDDGDETVIITDEELDALPAEAGREISIAQFVPAAQVDPLMVDRAYYLEPDAKSAKAYALLRETLAEAERTAIVTFTLRSRTRLGALRVRGEVIALQSLLWADEVRPADLDTAAQDAKPSAQEKKMARSLIEEFSADFEPEAFHDEYQQELDALIEDKLGRGESIDTAVTLGEDDDDSGGEVIDLMEALKRSVAARRSGSQEPGPGAGGGKKDRTKSREKTSAGQKGAAKQGAGKNGAGTTSTAKKSSKRNGAASKGAGPADAKKQSTDKTQSTDKKQGTSKKQSTVKKQSTDKKQGTSKKQGPTKKQGADQSKGAKKRAAG
ncbi:non-homologous end joining protein Ku [Brevibacterium rongguiense]|uniref:non-homologous end joining protein Ku n=1 Tax=Brevibacterium rongguiense TaxID=2695267 RepID=UPI0038B25DB3